MDSPTHDQLNQETTSAAADNHQSHPVENPKTESSETHFDLPPESFFVSKGDENDWFDQNATIERKTSRKLSFFPSSPHQNQRKPGSNRTGFSPSQKTKTSLIGFPAGQKPGLPNGKDRQNKAGSMYLFRSRSEPGRKSPFQATEPASPQVNCLGRIGTRRERGRKTGVWRSIVIMLRIRFKAQKMARTGPIEPVSNPPGLAGLKKLESAKRSETSKVEGQN